MRRTLGFRNATKSCIDKDTDASKSLRASSRITFTKFSLWIATWHAVEAEHVVKKWSELKEHASVIEDNWKVEITRNWRLLKKLGLSVASSVWKQLIKVGPSVVLLRSLPGSFSSMFTLVLRTFFSVATRHSRRDFVQYFILSSWPTFYVSTCATIIHRHWSQPF